MFAEDRLPHTVAPTTRTEATLARARDAQAIAQLCWNRHRLEQGLPIQPIADADLADTRRFHEMAEFLLNYLLEPDRRDAAMIAMADVLVGSGYLRAENAPSIFELSRKMQAQYLDEARTALVTLQLYLSEISPDNAYRDKCAGLMDALEPTL